MIHLQMAPTRAPRLQAGTLYFATCFVIGAMLGPVRELLLTPRLGYDRALAIEMIIMLLVSAAAARNAVRLLGGMMSMGDRMAVGAVASGLLVLAEDGLARLLSDQSIFSIWASQSDAAKVMTAMLMLLFAAMPALIGLNEARQR